MIDLYKLGIILSDTSRSRAYLQTLINKKTVPRVFIIMVSSNQHLIGKPKQMIEVPEEPFQYDNDDWSFDPNESIEVTLNKSKLEHIKLNVENINDPKVIPFLSNLDIDNLIYSGAGGIILKKELFNLGINFIHSHGGLLPKYQGSTCNYYSLIEENIIAASVILMNEKIDDGPILHVIDLKPNFDKTKIDHYYDQLIRAIALVKAFEINPTFTALEKKNTFKKSMYFVIHPVLKHIAILK